MYGSTSASPLQVADAVGSDCDLVWVVGRDAPPVGSMGAILSRLGTVVDVAGLDRDGAIEAIRGLRPDGVVAFSDGQLAFAAEMRGRARGSASTPPR